MNWLETERVTQTKHYKAILVYRNEIPEDWQIKFIENPNFIIGKVYTAIIKDDGMPKWMKECNQAIFPNIGMIFLGPCTDI